MSGGVFLAGFVSATVLYTSVICQMSVSAGGVVLISGRSLEKKNVEEESSWWRVDRAQQRDTQQRRAGWTKPSATEPAVSSK